MDMKNIELILWAIMVMFGMAFLLAIYEIVNKKPTPASYTVLNITAIYILIHIYNNWQ